MRIIIKECKKILDIRLLLILCIFSALYYNIFMEIKRYPAGGQMTSSPYDIPFAAELVREIGPTLAVKNWSVIDDKIHELKEEFAKVISDNAVLREAGITTYGELKKLEDDLLNMAEAEMEMSKNEKKLYDEICNVIFDDQKSSKIYFEIQYARNMNEFEGLKYGASQNDIDQYLLHENDVTKYYENTIRKKWTKQEASLLPEGVFYILQTDMCRMAVLLVICFFVLIIPYQVKERLRGVMPLYISTHTGRKVFGIQFTAGMLSCAAVGLLQLLVYLGIWAGKGLLIFWKCPSWSNVYNTCLIDFLPFGVYMLLYMLLVWGFALAGTVPAYWIGRLAANYIAGISLSIPFAGVIGYVGTRLLGALFWVTYTTQIGFWELIVLAIWLCIAGMLIWLRLKKDKRQDILL